MTAARVLSCLILLLAALPHVVQAYADITESEMFYYYDRDASLTFQQFSASVHSGTSYDSLLSADIPLGNGNHWVFFSLSEKGHVSPEGWILEIDFPNIDHVEAMVAYENGTVETFLTGDDIAFDKWAMNYRKPSIPLRYLSEHDAMVFFKIRSETPLNLPLNLITESEQREAQLRDHFIYGTFFGSIFILALYNAGIYFSLRDKSYRYYILYILSISIVQASTTGLGQQYLWPGMDNATTRIALLATILTNYFMIKFVIHFLDLRSHKAALVKPLLNIARAVLVLAPALLLPHYAYTQFAIYALNVASMIAMLMAAFVVLASNRPSAIYLLASYSMLFSAIFLALLFQLDFIPHNRFLDYSVPFAIILEAIILSIGLSEKVTKLRIENESAERQRRIIQEELSQQLIQTRERERAGISKLLHDSVNHELVVVRKNVSQLIVEDAFQSPTLRSKLTAITDMLHKVINEIRDISHLAHPHIVKHLGLETALKAMLERTFDSSFIWNLYIDKVELDYDTQLFLYRAVQESTTNILKHANASECLVRLAHDRSEHRIVFTLKDDGDGFDSSPYNWRFGLRTLNEHCKSVAGKLNIHSVTGEGTTLTILLPIKHGEIANG